MSNTVSSLQHNSADQGLNAAPAAKEHAMNIDNFAFIGAGKISETWIERLIASGEVSADRITACDPSIDRLDYLKHRYSGLKTTTENADGARFASFVVIAAPPPEIIPSLAKIRPALQNNAVVISLAAGVPLQKLVSSVPGVTVLRVMPNTPSMVGEAMNLVCYQTGTSAEVRERVDSLLSVLGKSLEIEEHEMEAYGALCSVGPTFLFPIIQSMIEASVEAGLSEPFARTAAAQVFLGTGKLVADSERSIMELNNMIGLHTLPDAEAKQMITAAYKDALGKLKGLAAKMSAAA